jgi:hypothetical protein
VSTEAIGDVNEDPSPILELDPEHSVGKDLENPTCNEIGRLGHEPLLYLNSAVFNHRPRGGPSRSTGSPRKPLFAVTCPARAGQDAGSFAGDGNGVLEVGRQRPVRGADRPSIRLDVDIR